MPSSTWLSNFPVEFLLKMKSILLLIPTAVFVSCAAQPKYKDITLEGVAAHNAFQEWSSSLPKEFAYPVDYRFDMDMTMTGIPELDGNEAKFLIGSNASFANAWDYRSRSDLSMAVMGQEFGVQIGIESGPEEFRIALDNAEMIEMMVGMEFPSGVSISTDRLRKVWDIVIQLTEVSLEAMEGFEDFEGWTESIAGFGDFGHPMLNSRYLSMSPMLHADLWKIEGDVVQVNFALDKELFRMMMSNPDLAATGIDLSMMDAAADSLATSASFNVMDGSMINMTILASIPSEDEFGDAQPLDISMTFDYSPLVEMIAPIEFSDPDTAMDINPYFDEYWPIVESMMPMIEAQMRQQMMNQSEGSDGDFEF